MAICINVCQRLAVTKSDSGLPSRYVNTLSHVDTHEIHTFVLPIVNIKQYI